METTEKGWVEITQPDVVEFIVRYGGLQVGDQVRFFLLGEETVGIPREEHGKWFVLKELEARRGKSWTWHTAQWVFDHTRDYMIIDGWRRRVDKNP